MRRRDCKGPAGHGLLHAAGFLLSRGTVPVAVVVLALCGCSQPLLVFRSEPEVKPVAAAITEEPAVTGSIAKRPVSFGADLGDEDWRRAHAALGVALDPQGNGRPVKWDNPESGLRGSVNPTGLPYVADDLICRDFLASVIAPERSRFVRGTGCRPSGGAWELKRLRAGKPT
ncbi:RT0821/Lpp0805 family surface protein [Methylobacterium trifolii]|uniref:Surface antigen domain-containing protein n=1 Tax=Methylobacterium trifolii TaxID=1003092 RepID=A0ABQ4U110_9HYPH|nr:RT0821/Lpp0805 family surface protein [Methylobacterium trifolii]GJE60567.1 hypothetical protein MPOCJGCO_2680 [Methylobacterium trifolii]